MGPERIEPGYGSPVGAVEDRLTELGLTLPAPFAPPPGVEFVFDLVRVHDGLAYVSGHLPVDGTMLVLLVYGSHPRLRPLVSTLWPWRAARTVPQSA